MGTDNPLHSMFMEPIHVLGAGSIGLLFAASIRTAFPSYPIRILLREHYAPTLQNQQRDHNKQECISVCLQHQRRLKTVHIPAQLISSAVSDSTKPPIRNLLLTTKAFQAVPAVRSILSRLAVGPARDYEESSSPSSSSSIPSQNSTTNLIVLCNGALAVRDELQELLAQEQLEDSVRIVLATTTHGAYREQGNAQEIDNGDGNDNHENGLFHVVHAGVGHTIIDESTMPTGIPKLSEMLDRAGLVCSSSSSAAALRTALWRKLAANCIINPLTALRQIRNGQLLEQSDWKHLLQSVAEEVAAVAAADTCTSLPRQQQQQQKQQEQNVQNDELTATSLQKYVEQVVTDTAANKSSMLQDVLAQRHTEIDYLSGYVVRRGRALGIDCPANEELWTQVRSQTASYTRTTD
jgi:2-dehydropantoate 2-reductase